MVYAFSSLPNKGTWKKNDMCLLTKPTSGDKMYINTTDGTPTWVVFNTIESGSI